MEKIKIRWAIAHEPEYLFVRTAEAFQKSLIEQGVDVEVDIITKSRLDKQGIGGLRAVMNMVENGSIHMTQTQVNVYGRRYARNFKVLDMPFLFRDHDHATRVLEGPIGKQLCAELKDNSPLTGLAFTYSGGWRIIGSDIPIKTLADLSDTKIRVNKNQVNYDMMAALGASPLKTIGTVEGYGYDKVKTGELDAVESTYLRFEGRNIFKTNHSMFLTNVSINTEFFESLPVDIQEAIKVAVFEAARVERIESIQDAEDFERISINNGINIYEISDEDLLEMKEKSKSVYAKWEPYFGEKLYKEIEKS